MATPKPIIAHVLRTLRVPPGLIYALVKDIEQNLWVVESCPAGTRFWTLEQAADLSQGPKTHRALQEILTSAAPPNAVCWRTPRHRRASGRSLPFALDVKS